MLLLVVFDSVWCKGCLLLSALHVQVWVFYTLWLYLNVIECPQVNRNEKKTFIESSAQWRYYEGVMVFSRNIFRFSLRLWLSAVATDCMGGFAVLATKVSVYCDCESQNYINVICSSKTKRAAELLMFTNNNSNVGRGVGWDFNNTVCCSSP